jgi:DNA-directed RNA polymerase subunit alpha
MFDITLPRILKKYERGSRATYEIEPLAPEYGATIGSLLKRTLCSLKGAAITAICIENISDNPPHLPGVKEDLTELILNIKLVRVRSSSAQPVSMYLDKYGVGEVTAADFKAPGSIEIINPELHLATLSHIHARLAMEAVVETGRGYVPAHIHKDQHHESIAVDAIYSPVLRVNYTVEHTRVGKMMNFDKIVLDITTDATITPDDALRQSSAILLQHFQAFTHPGKLSSGGYWASLSDLPIPQKIYEMPLEALSLSIRSINALKRHSKITKVGHILTLNEEELRSIRHVGDKVLLEIRDRLQAARCFPLIEQLHTQTDQGQQPTTTQ